MFFKGDVSLTYAVGCNNSELLPLTNNKSSRAPGFSFIAVGHHQ